MKLCLLTHFTLYRIKYYFQVLIIIVVHSQYVLLHVRCTLQSGGDLFKYVRRTCACRYYNVGMLYTYHLYTFGIVSGHTVYLKSVDPV